jgi:hypothetical protein
MRSLRLAVAATGVVAILASPVGAQAAAPDLTCNGPYSHSGTYRNVTVPPGGNCILTNATVLGNATVGSGGTLTLSGETPGSGRIHGNVSIGDAAWLTEDHGWVIEGSTTGNGAQDLQIDGVVHQVFNQDGSGLYLYQATVIGDLVSNHAQSGGSIDTSAVRGNLVINATTTSTDPLANWNISGPGLTTPFQQIYGSLILTNNQIPLVVSDNHIHQDLICSGNTAPPAGAAQTNRVDGRAVGQCAS